MPTDLVFNPAAADEALRAKTQPAPTQHPHYIEQSPRGRSRLDPTYEEKPLAALTPEAARAAGEKSLRKRREMEYAVANRPENTAMLAYKLGVPLEIVKRLYELQSENFLLTADIASLNKRLDALESSIRSQPHVADDLKSK